MARESRALVYSLPHPATVNYGMYPSRKEARANKASEAMYIIGASLSEPQGVMMSTSLLHLRACVRTYIHTYTYMYVRTYVSAMPAWKRVKSVWLGTSAVWDLMGG